MQDTLPASAYLLNRNSLSGVRTVPEYEQNQQERKREHGSDDRHTEAGWGQRAGPQTRGLRPVSRQDHSYDEARKDDNRQGEVDPGTGPPFRIPSSQKLGKQARLESHP